MDRVDCTLMEFVSSIIDFPFTEASFDMVLILVVVGTASFEVDTG